MLNNYFPVNDPVLGVYSGILHSNHSPLVRRRIGLASLPLLYSTKQEWWQAWAVLAGRFTSLSTHFEVSSGCEL